VGQGDQVREHQAGLSRDTRPTFHNVPIRESAIDTWSGEKRMDLPVDIRLKIEASTYKETIVDVVDRLQKEGVVITHDVLAAIQATIDLTRSVEE
jgi:hypothetical protein